MPSQCVLMGDCFSSSVQRDGRKEREETRAQTLKHSMESIMRDWTTDWLEGENGLEGDLGCVNRQPSTPDLMGGGNKVGSMLRKSPGFRVLTTPRLLSYSCDCVL